MEYEFTDTQDQTFIRIAFWMRIAALGSALSGVLTVINALNAFNLKDLASGGATLAVAVFLFTGAYSFAQIAKTSGDDIPHAMEGMRALRRYFFVQAASLLIMIIAMVLSLVGVT
jgi:hypothetical protein